MIRSKCCSYPNFLCSDQRLIPLIIGYEKCEKCRRSPATIECFECSGSQARGFKLCYECDKQHHSVYEKDKHSRKPIKFDQLSSKFELAF